MEFDSEEERKLFCGSGEDEGDSEFSSKDDDLAFLTEGQRGNNDKPQIDSTSVDSSPLELVLESASMESENDVEEERQSQSDLSDIGDNIEDDGNFDDMEGEESNDENAKSLVRQVSRPRFSSRANSVVSDAGSLGNEAVTPTEPLLLGGEEEKELFTDMFSVDLVNEASSFISTSSIDKEEAAESKQSKETPHSKGTKDPKMNLMEDLIPAANDIGLPESVFNPLSPEISLPSSPGSAELNTEPFYDSDPTVPVPPPKDMASSPHVEPSTATSKSGRTRRKGCGKCEGCLYPNDCRKCKYCKDMKRYGGRGKLRRRCIARQCRERSNRPQRELERMAAELRNASVEKESELGISKNADNKGNIYCYCIRAQFSCTF